MEIEGNKIKINGREFEFVKPTITFIKTISPKEYENIFVNLDKALSDSKEYRNFNKRWKEFCRDIFVSDWAWYFILPKELRLKNIPIDEVPEVARNFFALLQETRKRIEGLFKTSEDSGTTNKQE